MMALIRASLALSLLFVGDGLDPAPLRWVSPYPIELHVGHVCLEYADHPYGWYEFGATTHCWGPSTITIYTEPVYILKQWKNMPSCAACYELNPQCRECMLSANVSPVFIPFFVDVRPTGDRAPGDFDGDNDLDLRDWQLLQNAWTGPVSDWGSIGG